MNTIICGSKRYENLNFDKLVDNFDIIVRHNMLLPCNNYGKRNSDIQILNIHLNSFYTQKKPVDEIIRIFETPLWRGEFDISEEHIRKTCDYLKLDSVQFKYFEHNNTNLMIALLKKHNINHIVTKQLRCGFAYIAECIDTEIKPFLMGFSLKEGDMLGKQFSNKKSKGQCHDTNSEISLLKKLHKANLIDATFCAIEDSQDMKIDSSLLSPTTVSLDILNTIYTNVKKG